MSANIADIKTHTFDNGEDTASWSSTTRSALDALRPHLPTSLPLYRRLQFGHFTNTSTILTNLDFGKHDRQGIFHADAQGRDWLISYVDRSCRPETEALIFANWETATHGEAASEDQESQMTLMNAFAREAKRLPLPPSQHPEVADSMAASPGDITFGAVHERTAAMMRRARVLHVPVLPNDGISIPFGMFIFRLGGQHAEDQDTVRTDEGLTTGLRWGHLEPAHLAIVRARTPYPRLERTMAIMPNVGIFSDGQEDPIAWALIGLDGSLTSLHVEADWRRRGLGVLTAQKMFRDGMEVFWANDEASGPRFAHAYVAKGNIASEKLLHSAKGALGWNVHWIHTNLGA
jgi:hypothetical protein